jgi:hypothetical protein
MGGRLFGLADRPQRLTELDVDPAQRLGVATLLARELEGPLQRRGRLRRPARPDLRAAQVVEGARRGWSGAGGKGQGGHRLRRSLSLDQRHAQFQVRGRILRREPQLGLEMRNGLLDPGAPLSGRGSPSPGGSGRAVRVDPVSSAASSSASARANSRASR